MKDINKHQWSLINDQELQLKTKSAAESELKEQINFLEQEIVVLKDQKTRFESEEFKV